MIKKLGLIFLSLILVIGGFFIVKNLDQSKQTLVIYVAENDHGDMSYGALVEQLIIDCEKRGLSVKVFSEFSSQTAKSQKQKARAANLMSLKNNRKKVEATSRFLDRQFLKMGNIDERYAMYDETWKILPDDVTPAQLVLLLKNNVDNPELLRLMQSDIATGAISGVDKIGDVKNFYSYWRAPLHYKKIHEKMAQDVKNNLKNGVSDVMIIIAGTPHIKGLDQKLSNLKKAKKIVIGNFPKLTNPLDIYLYSANPKLVDGVGEVVGFEVDLARGVVTIPDVVEKILDEK